MCLQVIAAQQGRLEARTSTNHFFTPLFCTTSYVSRASCARFDAIAMPGMLYQAVPSSTNQPQEIFVPWLDIVCEKGAQIVA